MRSWNGCSINSRALCLALAASAAFGAPDDAQTARDSSDAYVALVQADQARNMQDWKGAVAGYRDAGERYSRLAKIRPDWEPDIVQYRITYCANQVDAIVRKTGRSVEDWLNKPDDPADEDTSVYRERYFALLQENQYLHQRLAEMQEEAPGAENGSVEFAGTNELNQLRQDNELLRQKLEAAWAKTEGGPGDEASAIEEALDENVRLRGELETTQADNERMAGELERLKSAAASVPAVDPARAAPAKASGAQQDTASLMNSALAQEKQGNHGAALTLYNRAKSARPDYVPAHLASARCLLHLNRTDDALAALEKASLLGPDDAEEFDLLMGIACGAAGQYERSATLLANVLQASPENARARAALGAARMGLGDVDGARAELEKAGESDPSLADVHYNLAQVLLASRPPQVARAQEHYRKAVNLGAPADAEIELRLAAP